MSNTKRIGTLKLFLVLALLLLLEIFVYYSLGIGATDFDRATTALYFTQTLLVYATLFRVCAYLAIWFWNPSNRTKFRFKAYTLFLMPVVANFGYEMIYIAPTFQNWPVRATYFIAYLVVEIILAIGFITFVEKYPLPEAKRASIAE